jgi:hypothetical protein
MRWLTGLLVRHAARRAVGLLAPQRQWAQAALAEWDALPADARRLGWALGAWWFVMRLGSTARRSTMDNTMLTRTMAVLGPLTVLPWAVAFALQLGDDAPDGTTRSSLAMLLTQSVVMAAFLGCLGRWPGRAGVLVLAILAYGAAAWFAASDNDGAPLLAAVIFITAPVLAAAPIVAVDLRHRRRT